MLMVNVNGKAMNKEQFKEYIQTARLDAARRKRIKANHQKRLAANKK